MKIIGERVMDVPLDTVWKSLFDPIVLKQCIPGCEAISKESETLYSAVTVMSIGPLKARFSGKLEIVDVVVPTSCTLIFEGSGGAVGLAKGRAEITLDTVDSGTRLCYSADAQIAGKLAQVGARLIDSVAKKLAGEFFDKFETAVRNVHA